MSKKNSKKTAKSETNAAPDIMERVDLDQVVADILNAEQKEYDARRDAGILRDTGEQSFQLGVVEVGKRLGNAKADVDDCTRIALAVAEAKVNLPDDDPRKIKKDNVSGTKGRYRNLLVCGAKGWADDLEKELPELKKRFEEHGVEKRIQNLRNSLYARRMKDDIKNAQEAAKAVYDAGMANLKKKKDAEKARAKMDPVDRAVEDIGKAIDRALSSNNVQPADKELFQPVRNALASILEKGGTTPEPETESEPEAAPDDLENMANMFLNQNGGNKKKLVAQLLAGLLND